MDILYWNIKKKIYDVKLLISVIEKNDKDKIVHTLQGLYYVLLDQFTTIDDLLYNRLILYYIWNIGFKDDFHKGKYSWYHYVKLFDYMPVPW